MSPYPHQSKEERAFWDLTRSITETGAGEWAEALISFVEKSGSAMDEPWKRRMMGPNWRAVDAARRGLISWTSVEGMLAVCSTPCLLIAGVLDPFHDGARRAAGVMSSASFVSLLGLDHGGAFDYSSHVLPHVKRFLSEIF